MPEPDPLLPQPVIDAVVDALHEHYMVLFTLDADDEGTLTVWVAMEDAHIDRHITFDMSARKLPDDWHRTDAPTGPGTPTYTWSEQKAPDYDAYTWTEHTAAVVQQAIRDALASHRLSAEVRTAYVPTTPARVRDRLVAMKARAHSGRAHEEHVEPGASTGH